MFPEIYFNASNIESIIFDYEKSEIFISFVPKDSHDIASISIKERYCEMAITLFEKEVTRNRYVSRNGFYDLNRIFKSLCNLDGVFREKVIIDVIGDAYQTSTLQNYYEEKKISDLDKIEID